MAQAKKYEIEKKYLGDLASFPFTITDFPYHKIEQAYLHRNPTIRIRRQDSQYILTIKGSGHLSREEYELPITEEQYLSLGKKVETPFITKKRYLVPLPSADHLVAEIDLYEGPLLGLVTIEVEFPSTPIAEMFQPPAWFGEDVSLDNRYKNASLAVNGIPAAHF